MVSMKMARATETSVNLYQRTRRYNPGDGHLQVLRVTVVFCVGIRG
jgi:hypothetical protein